MVRVKGFSAYVASEEYAEEMSIPSNHSITIREGQDIIERNRNSFYKVDRPEFEMSSLVELSSGPNSRKGSSSHKGSHKSDRKDSAMKNEPKSPKISSLENNAGSLEMKGESAGEDSLEADMKLLVGTKGGKGADSDSEDWGSGKKDLTVVLKKKKTNFAKKEEGWEKNLNLKETGQEYREENQVVMDDIEVNLDEDPEYLILKKKSVRKNSENLYSKSEVVFIEI